MFRTVSRRLDERVLGLHLVVRAAGTPRGGDAEQSHLPPAIAVPHLCAMSIQIQIHMRMQIQMQFRTSTTWPGRSRL